MITAAYADKERTTVLVKDDSGSVRSVPSDPKNQEFHALVHGDENRSPVPIADYKAPTPGPTDVRHETLRRLMLAFAARDERHLSIKVQDAVIMAGKVTDKTVGGGKLTAAEKSEAEKLRTQVDVYLAIKAAGNAMEANPPVDFADDKHWP